MAYEISFRKSLDIENSEKYINDCCFGGDMVSDLLLPTIQKSYSSVRANQEDWGWFIWFKSGQVSMGVDIHCDDPGEGAFRARLFANQKRFLRKPVENRQELETLRDRVVPVLKDWTGQSVDIQKVDSEPI